MTLHGLLHGHATAKGTSIRKSPMPGARVERARGCPQGILRSLWSSSYSRRFRRTPVNTATSDPIPFPLIRASWAFRVVSALVVHGLVHGRFAPHLDLIPGQPQRVGL